MGYTFSHIGCPLRETIIDSTLFIAQSSTYHSLFVHMISAVTRRSIANSSVSKDSILQIDWQLLNGVLLFLPHSNSTITSATTHFSITTRCSSCTSSSSSTRMSSLWAWIIFTTIHSETCSTSLRGPGTMHGCLASIWLMLTWEEMKSINFKGHKGENPEVPLLKATDCLQHNRITDGMKSLEFGHTLDDRAQEWLKDITVSADWDTMQALFWGYFSVHSRSTKYLCERWRDLKFDHSTDEIEVFIRHIKQMASQLNHNDMTF